MVWCVVEALWASTGFFLRMQSRFLSWEGINHTALFSSLTFSLRKKNKSDNTCVGTGSSGSQEVLTIHTFYQRYHVRNVRVMGCY